jgi:hypothetical protein
MMVSKNTITAISKMAVVLLFIGLQSCGTYNTKTTIESDLFSGDFNKAITGIDQNKFLLKDRNRLLYLMEKGKIEHLRGNYESSNALLEQAHILIDDKIKTNVGQAISAKFTNPMAEPYKGEDFEKVTIHYYMALNYFHLGLPNEALVEAKRINLKLYELNEKYPSDKKNKYNVDAFSQILQGLIYESTGDINNAFIAYRNAEEIYSRANGTFFGVPMPEQLRKDLLRTSRQMGFREEYEAYLKKFSMPKEQAPGVQPAGEAIVFWENGLGPAKDQIIITVSDAGPFFYATYMDEGIVQDILIPIPTGTDIGSINAIAIPKYRKRESFYNKAGIVVNGNEQPLELAQDFYPIAKQCLKDRMLREVIDLVVRFAAKKTASAGLGVLGKQLLGEKDGEDIGKLIGDIAGAATENADTRNWQSLPATIGYTRVPLKEGNNNFVIRKYGPEGVIDTDTLSIPYRRGLQIVNYFDLGRTQILLATTKQPAAVVGNLKIADKQPALLAANNNSNYKPAEKAAEANKPVTPALDAAILEKYDKWYTTDKGISYKVSYAKEVWNGKEVYSKTVTLKSANPEKVKVSFAITDQPFDSGYAEIEAGDFYKHLATGETGKEYFKISEKLKPNKETETVSVYSTTPDFYVTLLNVE